MTSEARDGLERDLKALGWVATDIVADSAATLIPFVPAGVTKALRAADDVTDAAKQAKK